ncbi:hypothetical protein B2D07_00970 [Desulfococcus multivorans]|jgi:ElaB/YqjD/DUF883 family membrane-anchored ribosome-binding protein|nr:hypothetical protein B2D07_00900 [Desulfococcus multivorans]AQU99488.1 hypothetical protein B2D07_00970 [Desulfococcus multivorans]
MFTLPQEVAMNTEKNKDETPKQQTAEGPGSVNVAAQNILERSGEVYVQAEQAVGDAYDKTTEKVSETYEKAKSFGKENPGKSILIAFGIGIGVGFLLGASTRRSGVTGRLARPVVNALSDIALDFWR